MNPAGNVLTVDITERPPLMPGEHFMGADREEERADIVDRRFLSSMNSGRILTVRFSDDFGLIVNDGLWAAASPFEGIWRSDGLYVLSMRLLGNCLESIDLNTYPLGAFTCSMIHYAEGVKHVFRKLTDEPLVEVCGVFRASFFAKKYNITAAEAELLLHPPKHRALDPWFNQCRMTPKMEAVIHELRGASPFKRSFRLFAEAKTLELVSLYLEQLEDKVEPRDKPPIAVNDLLRLYAVREYLGRHYRQAPRIDKLCRMVGFNRRKLTEGFKSEFGRTVYEYIQYLRMEQARALFQNGFTDISKVASQVGYRHQGNFTKAFKHYLGISPRKFALAQREGLHSQSAEHSTTQ